MRLSKIDPNSFSNPEDVVIKHIDLIWNVNFDKKTLSGVATIHFDILAQSIEKILLDVSDLSIESVNVKSAKNEIPIDFEITDHVENIGSKLTLFLPTQTSGKLIVIIKYETSASASGLLWLASEQTCGKKHPYLFSQCQAIHARSILPCQDTPAVKFTYNSVLYHPAELTGLMSAIRTKNLPGESHFEQTVPIPSYLLAIVVGAIVSRDIGPISSVWAEQEQIEESAEEFSQTNDFLKKAEEICGPYVWKRYDLLILPPSFPFGGMENPCLTFITPTCLAGDKSLANVVAHEISHSWTGNLVTNQNFEHFWLNEGFTIFVEQKILGRLNGPAFRDFHALHGLSELTDCIKVQLANEPELTKLVVDLTNLGPDDAFSTVPYIKGSTFLRYLEQKFGGPEVFEAFLRSYLNKFKFQSILTDSFKSYLYEYFNKEPKYEQILASIDWDKWLFSEGMPPIIPDYDHSLVDACKRHADLWADNNLDTIKASSVIQEKLLSVQVIEFLALLLEKKTIVDLNGEKLSFLVKTYKLNETKNSEIRFRLVRLYIKARLFGKMTEILQFLNSNFRLKFVRPIYKELGQWPEAKPLAIENFAKYKIEMMAVCVNGISKDLGL
uniref:Leukotriene A(4) hydrolase n=1 Tax=Corethrella appendiculata TaxID=1370023 RepID=U5EZH8_9DIPT